VSAIPVLTYHRVAPGERIDPARFAEHVEALARSGLPSLPTGDLERAARGFVLTFDDGFAEVWTRALPVLREHGVRAVVFAVPSRAGSGGPRPPGGTPFGGSAGEAHAEAARSGGPHPAFLRWSELQALEATGLVEVQSHSWGHAMGWVSDEITGFHLGRFGRTHWSLPQCTGGDERLGIPLYRRGSVLAHRVYWDDPGLRDHLARWLEARGGEAYIADRGPDTVRRELLAEARRHRQARGERGRWETEAERKQRTVEDLVRAREALEARLGGRRDELALPWGQYDRVTLECARRAGIRRVYTLDRRPNPVGRVGFLVHRFEPRPRGTLWLRTRLWIYRSTWRTTLYGIISGRRGAGGG